ncbi:hypothetical protein Scep_007825 [Stephania cephalantha]|uniref:Reverse transcriptase zinc-binding domain-containing protein n=1 Tax=Stephania cephalantha TaxID=152367 RepID=A0AAP0KAK4_9MAGN
MGERFSSGLIGGEFTVALAYKASHKDSWRPNICRWDLAWKWEGPERIRMFIWLVFQGALLANVERKRRHLTEFDTCEVCGEHVETIEHTLRQCPISTSIWIKIVGIQLWRQRWEKLPFEAWFMRNLLKSEQVQGIKWVHIVWDHLLDAMEDSEPVGVGR